MALALILLTAGWASAQNDSVKTQGIIKTIQIAADGTTTVDSLVLDLDDNFRGFYGPRHANGGQQSFRQFKMQGPGGRGMMWSNAEEIDYEITVDENGDSTRIIVMKTPCGLTREFTEGFAYPQGRMAAASGRSNRDFTNQRQQRNGNRRANAYRNQQQAPSPRFQGNMINLNDPDIKSFEKEILKNGDEKITIIRER